MSTFVNIYIHLSIVYTKVGCRSGTAKTLGKSMEKRSLNGPFLRTNHHFKRNRKIYATATGVIFATFRFAVLILYVISTYTIPIYTSALSSFENVYLLATKNCFGNVPFKCFRYVSIFFC